MVVASYYREVAGALHQGFAAHFPVVLRRIRRVPDNIDADPRLRDRGLQAHTRAPRKKRPDNDIRRGLLRSR